MPFCGPSGPACVRTYSPHPCTSCCVGSRTPQMGHIRGLAMSGVWLLVAKTSAGLVRGPPDLDPEVLDLDPPNGSRIHGSRVFLCWSVEMYYPIYVTVSPLWPYTVHSMVHAISHPWLLRSRGSPNGSISGSRSDPRSCCLSSKPPPVRSEVLRSGVSGPGSDPIRMGPGSMDPVVAGMRSWRCTIPFMLQ